MVCFEHSEYGHVPSGRYPSGQRGQTVNLLPDGFQGSNPCLPTMPERSGGPAALEIRGRGRRTFDQGWFCLALQSGSALERSGGPPALVKKPLSPLLIVLLIGLAS